MSDVRHARCGHDRHLTGYVAGVIVGVMSLLSTILISPWAFFWVSGGSEPQYSTNDIIFAVLIFLPFGVIFGFLTTIIPFLLMRAIAQRWEITAFYFYSVFGAIAGLAIFGLIDLMDIPDAGDSFGTSGISKTGLASALIIGGAIGTTIYWWVAVRPGARHRQDSSIGGGE